MAPPTGSDPATIDEVLATWSDDVRLTHVERQPARPARLAAPEAPLHRLVADRLGGRPLWAHQARAIDLVRAGRSVVLATPTASGKSLCFQIPAVEAALTRRSSTLMVFPTKALAQDQLRSLTEWDVPGVIAATYDGDCTPEERSWVRSHADLLLTNPEMLHQGILPNHGRWATFLHRLELVVVDELHTLRGVFGTHAAQVLRRLRRLAQRYGASPRFVFTSATIGDPAELASELCGLPVTAIAADGSPSGPRTIALWNPGMASDPDTAGPDDDLGDEVTRRWSLHAESAAVAADAVLAGLRTLVFCRSRRSTELVAEEIRRRVATAPGVDRSGLASAVRSYRAGYLVDERREIESELFAGRLRCVVATSALELGVDIGGLDAVVLSGYPGTVASFWQQVGRAGRHGRPSLAILVAGQDQLDQWMSRHPAELIARAPEPAVINPDNPDVYVPHLACAAQEQALSHDDAVLWPDQLDEAVRRLVVSDRASVRWRQGARVAVWTGRGLPAPTIALRSDGGGEVTIIDGDDRVIGTVDAGRAPSTVHPGAVYLHQGRPWKVVELDVDEGVARVEATDGATYTVTRSTTSLRVLETTATGRVGAAASGLGTVEVTTEVLGYQVRSVATHEVIERIPLELPPHELVTRGVWFVFDEELVGRAAVDDRELPGALHAVEHAAIGILPLFTICDRWDVGGVSTPWSADTGGPTVVIHDAHRGGAGIAELAFAASERLLVTTLEVIESCECDDGCPGCIQSPKCGNGNEPLAKAAAARLLDATARPGRRRLPARHAS